MAAKGYYHGTVDKHPRTDVYIPEAEIEADMVAKERNSQEWSNAFVVAMNTILSKEGLRVL